MPSLQRINITQFRNITSATLEPNDNINIIHGENGSGKTSILEAISVLAHGRSFRTHKYKRLIKNEETSLTLHAQLFEHVERHIGLSRQNSGQLVIRIDGKPAYTAVELAECLPLLVMNANSFSLLEGAAKVRRQFFDWLVFHVKHDFKHHWKVYAKCIKHRNSLLRRDKISRSDLIPWDKELTKAATELEKLRRSTFEIFEPTFNHALASFSFIEIFLKDTPSVDYLSGWKSDDDYLEQLSHTFERDRQLGYTSIGSHKADLKISLGKVPAVEELSRGQQKSLIISLFLAEARVFQQLTRRKPVFLLDDLPAELDETNLRVVGEALNDIASQVFVTAIDPSTILDCWELPEESMLKVFHVKHGQLHTKN